MTPREIVEAARAALGRIGIDPFHHHASDVGADRVIDVRAGGDGFADSWGDITDPAWCNPPFSRSSDALRRCGCEALAGRSVILLTSFRPEGSAWWSELWDQAPTCRALLIPAGRMAFRAPAAAATTKQGPMIGCAFVVWAPCPVSLSQIVRRFRAELLSRAQLRTAWVRLWEAQDQTNAPSAPLPHGGRPES